MTFETFVRFCERPLILWLILWFLLELGYIDVCNKLGMISIILVSDFMVVCCNVSDNLHCHYHHVFC